MKNWRIEEKSTNNNIKAKIINLKKYDFNNIPALITVKKVELKAQNFKNKIIKQSYNIDFLPYICGLYINKTNVSTLKNRFIYFENSNIFYMYNVLGKKRRGVYCVHQKAVIRLNREIIKLRKSKKPLELLPELFENLGDKNVKFHSLYDYYDYNSTFYLTGYNKNYVAIFNIYLHIWRKFILDNYKHKVTNLALETLKQYNANGLAKLQAVLDLSELGYQLAYQINPLETLFYYINDENENKSPQFFHLFKEKQDFSIIYYLRMFKNQEKTFLKGFLSKYACNKFEGCPYMSFTADDLSPVHYLEDYYKIFDLKLINQTVISYAKKQFYLLNYIYTEGPCLTAGLELQKIKNLNINGVKIKKNSFNSKLSLEQVSLITYVLIAS
jgi:hypothetical protein